MSSIYEDPTKYQQRFDALQKALTQGKFLIVDSKEQLHEVSQIRYILEKGLASLFSCWGYRDGTDKNRIDESFRNFVQIGCSKGYINSTISKIVNVANDSFSNSETEQQATQIPVDQPASEPVVVQQKPDTTVLKRAYTCKPFTSRVKYEEAKVSRTPAKKVIDLHNRLEQLAEKFGYKYANLAILQDIFEEVEDVEIPKFAGIEHEIIQNFLRSEIKDFDQLWNKFCENYRSTKDLNQCAGDLKDLQQKIESAFKKFDHPILQDMIKQGVPLMVRSTGREDSKALANPGGNLSVANVKPEKEAVKEAIGKVIASYFSLHSLTQRVSSQDDITTDPFMPVLLQVMAGEKPDQEIPPTSGVMFTQDELKTPGVVEINATFGHAEAVVTGTRPTDKFFIQGEFVHAGISDGKISRLQPDYEKGGLKVKNNPEGFNLKPSLTPMQSIRLAEIGKQIEEIYGYPVDVEWSFNPETKSYSIFQSRPIEERPTLKLTYIDPKKFPTPDKIHPVEVIGIGSGGVVHLQKDAVMIVNEASKETIAHFEKLKAQGKEIQAIIVKNPCARTSHEASFFKKTGVPLIHPYENGYQKVKEALEKGSSCLLDVQEGVIVETAIEDGIILFGLRRHTVPKQESHFAQGTEEINKEFLTEIFNLGELDIEEKKEMQLLQNSTYGRGTLDKLLNCYEQVKTDKEKAYFLKRILTITAKSAQTATPAVREEFLEKAYYNARHLWSISKAQGEECSEKFALIWLRSALIEARPTGLVGGVTLYTLLREQSEREFLKMPEEPSTYLREYRDIFHRSSKFLIDPADKKKWGKFVESLKKDEIQILSEIFITLGPQIVELWINSSFLEVYNDEASEVLSLLVNEIENPEFRKALDLCRDVKGLLTHLREASVEFGDQNQFDQAIGNLRQFHPNALKCIEAMKTSKGLSATLLAITFNEIVTVYDESIKAFTSSPNYFDLKDKANKFIELLKLYRDLAVSSMDPEILKSRTDNALTRQGGVLVQVFNIMLTHFEDQLKNEKLSERKLNDLFLPSPDFVVTNARLGSGTIAPRMEPKSLEDLFMFMHQSMLTVVQHVILQKGKSVNLQSLPREVQSVTRMIEKLDLHSDISSQKHPTIQTIEYLYPEIKVTFNAPLNNHSSSFIVTMQMKQGKLDAIKFEGQFFAANRAGETDRAKNLFYFIFEKTYGGYGFEVPNDYEMRYERNTVRFKWKIPLENQDETLKPASGIVQTMIDYLQASSNLTYNTKILENYPDLYKFHPDPHQITAIQSFFKGVNNHFNQKTGELFLEDIIIIRINGPTEDLRSILNKLISSDFLWNNPKNLIKFIYLIKEIDPSQLLKNELSRRWDKEYIEKLQSNPWPEIFTSIKEKINNLVSIPMDGLSDYEKKQISSFISDYSNSSQDFLE